jgi:hypothetical protein
VGQCAGMSPEDVRLDLAGADEFSIVCQSLAGAERWAAGLPGPGYAIDDQTAIKVTDGAVEVVSEGHWRLFTSDS